MKALVHATKKQSCAFSKYRAKSFGKRIKNREEQRLTFKDKRKFSLKAKSGKATERESRKESGGRASGGWANKMGSPSSQCLNEGVIFLSGAEVSK